MKKPISVFLASSILLSSFSTASTCESEKNLLEIINNQKKTVDSQLNQSRAGLTSVSLGALPLLLFFPRSMYGEFKLGSVLTNSGVAKGIGASYTALTATNIYLKASDVKFYIAISSDLEKLIEERRQKIISGDCLSDRAEKSTKQNIKELYTALNNINRQLAIDIYRLSEELGNEVSTASTYANISGSILYLVSIPMSSIDETALVSGSAMLIHTASQITMLPSALVAKSEAKKLLSAVRIEQERLLAQEQLLAEILQDNK